jgi:hypothetical protein
VGGGTFNTASGEKRSISGGWGNEGRRHFEFDQRRQDNVTSGKAASLLGGRDNELIGNCGTFPATGQSC